MGEYRQDLRNRRRGDVKHGLVNYYETKCVNRSAVILYVHGCVQDANN